MKESSPIRRVVWAEDLPASTSLHSAVGAQHDGGFEGDATTGGSRFLEVSPSYDAVVHRLGSPADEHEEDSHAHESSVPERPHCLEEGISNILDGTTPEQGIAIDEASPEASNEDKVAFVLSDPDAEANKKRKPCTTPRQDQVVTIVKKARKRPVNVWAKSSSRKGGKRNSRNGSQSTSKNATLQNVAKEDHVYITLANKHQEKIEDGLDLPVVLSKFHKAEKIELSDDRLSAGNTKGYRMVRATRGVVEGAWYFEILVEKLGPSGHTRLGWSTQKGEIQAPVGFDNHSYAYRDVDGSKVHMAIRETYGEPYVEGDVIGFYINLPNGAEHAPKPPTVVSYKGQPYILEEKEDPPKIVPGSEIAFFRNGNCQGTAFKDINAGRYFPAASMYTLPNDPKCVVKFHFGPDFRFPPKDIGKRPIPQPIACAPHCGMDLLGFGTISLKSESSGLDATHTPKPQSTGKVIRTMFVFLPQNCDSLLLIDGLKLSDAERCGACACNCIRISTSSKSEIWKNVNRHSIFLMGESRTQDFNRTP